jgi:N-acetylglucosaminyldiphosphoundecaprenol N-acetyl-beta-D-mannosaminyltransferase
MNRVESALLQISLTPLAVTDILAFIDQAERSTSPALIVGHNLHSAYLFHTDDDFRRVYDSADVVLVDGTPILWALNAQRRLASSPSFGPGVRVGSTDWIGSLGSITSVKRVAVVGASALSNIGAVVTMRRKMPHIDFLGFAGESWDAHRLTELEEVLLEFAPDVILVGLGMPLQESVADSLRDKGFGRIIATVGGAIDQFSGNQKNAPRWLGRFGVEWAWRLASQPKRLWRRYLIEPVKLARILLSKRGKTN